MYLCSYLQDMARLLALDYGTKRVGIAVTDELQIIASGLCTVRAHDCMDFLKEYISKEEYELSNWKNRSLIKKYLKKYE